MEIASNKGVIADASTPAGRAGMSESEWREAIKFDSTDTGWVIMSIGMAIGAGIVFLPVQVGLMGLWVFLLSSVIGYPAMYLFQRLFINTLAESPECKDYPSVISGYLGKNWGILLGALYFVMLVIWMFVYSTAITNDSASYLHTRRDGRVAVKWSTKTGHRVRVFSSIDFPIRLVVTHHYIRAVLVRCNIQRYSPLLRELHR